MSRVSGCTHMHALRAVDRVSPPAARHQLLRQAGYRLPIGRRVLFFPPDRTPLAAGRTFSSAASVLQGACMIESVRLRAVSRRRKRQRFGHPMQISSRPRQRLCNSLRVRRRTTRSEFRSSPPRYGCKRLSLFRILQTLPPAPRGSSILRGLENREQMNLLVWLWSCAITTEM